MMLPPSVINGAAARDKRHERIRADVVRDAEGLAAGVDEFAFQRVLGRERDRVQQQMQLAKLFARRSETRGRCPRPWSRRTA